VGVGEEKGDYRIREKGGKTRFLALVIKTDLPGKGRDREGGRKLKIVYTTDCKGKRG